MDRKLDYDLFIEACGMGDPYRAKYSNDKYSDAPSDEP